MANFFTPDVQRGTYDRVVSLLASQMNMSVEAFTAQYKVMPSVLKLAQYLTTGPSTYTFSPRKGVDLAIPNTNLLDFNDFFAIAGIGLRLGRAAFASNAYSNHGNYPLMTFPDPSYFNGNGSAAGKEWEGLQCIVNGTTGINVNSDAMIDGIVSQELFYRPQSPYALSPLEYPQFGGSDQERGVYPITPQIILDASADNGIVVNLANGAKGNIDGAISTATTDSGLRNILYVMLSGWKIKNLAGAGNAVCGKV